MPLKLTVTAGSTPYGQVPSLVFPSRSWSSMAEYLGLSCALFLAVFLVISIVALYRAQIKDIPETVRALAQLLHPNTGSGSSRRAAARHGDDRDESQP